MSSQKIINQPKLKYNIIANYLGQGWVSLVGLMFIPVYIKYLGIEAYGLIGFFTLLQTCLTLLNIGLTPTLGREMARFIGGEHTAQSIRDLLRSVEILGLGVAFLIVSVFFLGADRMANSWLNTETLSTDTVEKAFGIMGVVIVLRFFEGIYRSTIVGLQRQVLFNLINSGMATLRGVGSVVTLVWISPTILAFFVWQGLSSLITLVALTVTVYWSLPKSERRGRFSINEIRGVWRFAGGMTVIILLATLLTQVDKIVLSKLLSLREFGYYSLAATVAAALYILVSSVTQAFYPRLCEFHARKDFISLTETYHSGAQLVSVIAGSAAIVLILFSQTFLHLWTQDLKLASHVSPLLSLLVLGNLLNGLTWVPHQTQLAYGMTSLLIKINVFAVIFIVPAIFWVTPHFGAMGAAWVWVGLNVAYVFVAVHFMYRRVLSSEKWLWYRKDIFLPIISATIPALALKLVWPETKTFVDELILLVLASCLTITAASFGANRVRTLMLKTLGLFWTRFIR